MSGEPWEPLSVRYGDRKATRAWRWRGFKERVALRMAPWLFSNGQRGEFAGDAKPMVGGIAPRQTEILVYGECGGCAWRGGLPEGSRWPLCPGCGKQVMPPSSDGLEGPRYAYAARLLPEGEAVDLVRASRQGHPL